MTTYVYREDCGEFEASFEAEDDNAAQAHVMDTWRSPSDPDFDGDSAMLWKIEDDGEGGEFEAGVISFECADALPDPYNQRRGSIAY